MIEIHLPFVYLLFINKKICRKAVHAALEMKSYKCVPGLSLVFVDDHKIRKLNKLFRKIDSPTDVLAFPAGEKCKDLHIYLGDVFISFPHAVMQARQHRHAIQSEIVLLIIHGVLHLMGYDHFDKKSKERMWMVQEEALKKMGIAAQSLKI